MFWRHLDGWVKGEISLAPGQSYAVEDGTFETPDDLPADVQARLVAAGHELIITEGPEVPQEADNGSTAGDGERETAKSRKR